MSIEDFFEFSLKVSSTTIQARAIDLKSLEDEVDDHRKLIIGQYEEIEFPVVFEQEYGHLYEDILGTGWPDLYLISEEMKEILKKNNLTGWKTFPIKLLDKKGTEVRGYFGLSIIGRCGRIDYRKSEIIEKRLVPTGPIGKYYKGLHIGLDSWDGCDFFLPEMSTAIIISSVAAEVLIKSGLRTIMLENLALIETPSFALAPGRDLV